MARLNVNGKNYDVDAEPAMPLLWAIREQVGLTGTKYGCGVAQCGACTVHIDGAAVRSCVVPANSAAGKKITTIEGLAVNGQLTKVQKAWVENEVPQCGYCQAGQIMSATALLSKTPKPSPDEILAGMTGNICRCATYLRIQKAIRKAAGLTATGAAA